jgi:chlorite dismutase|tara:strand:- start:269 stop:499 length:231 start_codon:yes stop_codon:yes gene_type:complete
MKKTIAEVLKRYQDRQVNLASEAARNLLAAEIEAALLNRESQHKYPTKKDIDGYLVSQYNRNRPIEEHIKDPSEIK